MKLILAKNGAQARAYMRENGLDFTQYKVITKSEQLYGAGIHNRKVKITCVGDFWQSPVYQSNAFLAMARNGLIEAVSYVRMLDASIYDLERAKAFIAQLQALKLEQTKAKESERYYEPLETGYDDRYNGK